MLSKAQVKITTYRHPQPGWVENDADDFWRTLCSACQKLWANTPIARDAVRAVVVTTQRATMINLDALGQPLRPAIVWMDQRRSSPTKRLAWWWEAAFRAIGMRETVDFFQREAEANWIAQHQPDLWARTDKYLMLSGYLNYRMCGRIVDAVGAQVGYVPFDYKRGRWAAAHDWKWQCLAVRREMLPELVPSGSRIGEVSTAASIDTGIPAGVPLIAGAADKACEVIGAGCLSPEVACLSYGTAATINTTTPRYVEAVRFIPPYPAALPGHYSTEIQITRGYWMVSWFAQEFGLHERQLALAQGVSPESFFDELVNAVPPGSLGLMLQPFWSPGVKIPGPEAKGAVIGFGDAHTRAHLYRAILEGLAYALREGKERIEQRSGMRIERVRVAGGGSQSDAAMQITADVFNLPTERASLYETSGLGAAMLGAVGIGWHADMASAAREMTRVGRCFEPDARHARTYDELYTRVYKGMYQRLAPLYREIRNIVDCPSALESQSSSRPPS